MTMKTNEYPILGKDNRKEAIELFMIVADALEIYKHGYREEFETSITNDFDLRLRMASYFEKAAPVNADRLFRASLASIISGMIDDTYGFGRLKRDLSISQADLESIVDMFDSEE